MPRRGLIVVGVALLLLHARARAQEPAPKPTPQNPSPMVERTRAHERLEQREHPGQRFSIDGVLAKPIDVFVPRAPRGPVQLLVHFHGTPFVAEHAVVKAATDYVLACINLGAGSAVYDRAFTDPAVFDAVLRAIGERVGRPGDPPPTSRIVLSGFSAGHGAIRAILREPRHMARVDAVLLIDGLHTGYVPPRTVLAEGGSLDPAGLTPFVPFAQDAIKGTKAMVVTHSEIFPGTFASTTETTDYLIDALGLKRVPVLEWGPLGMQLLSRVVAGRLSILGFAGNSAPDHVDHYHSMYYFLQLLDARGDARRTQ